MRVLLSILLLTISVHLFGQATNFNNVNVLGWGGRTIYKDHFSQRVDTFKNANLNNGNIFFNHGSSNICDSNGKLLLLCNGME